MPKIKDGTYVINLDEFKLIGTHWISLYVNGSTPYDATYFNSFGDEHIPNEINKFIGNKNIITNIYRIKRLSSITCEFFCIGFIIDFMLKGKRSLDYTIILLD